METLEKLGIAQDILQNQQVTAEELFWMRETEGKRELVKGKIIEMTPVGFKHGRIVVRLAARLLNHVESNQLGEVATELGFILSRKPDVVRAPDVAYVLKNRIPSNGIPEGYFEGAPDLAVEVLSPSDSMSEMLEKITNYFSAGTKAVWIIDPRTETVEIYHSSTKINVLVKGDILSGRDILPGFQIQVDEMFE